MEPNWMRIEIVQKLRQGYNGNDEQACIEQQADAIMEWLHTLAKEGDTFHLLVGYLNTIRLDTMRERAEDKEW